MIETIKAEIDKLTYRAGKSMRECKLEEYSLCDFDINLARASGTVVISPKNQIAYSKWVTPKRTRTYPFARIYDTYSFGGKRITVIPVIKDEGMGSSKNKSNNDRINFITLSWMNLTNVFVILAWYSDAKKQSEYRITQQKFDVQYVRQKIKEISEYQFDAHHWNNQHFTKDFRTVYEKAVSSYEDIAQKLSVKLHPSSNHNVFLDKISDRKNPTLIDLNKFASETLAKSKLAAGRETEVKHQKEYLSYNSKKVVFEIKNNLGGSYFLTSDEIDIDKSHKKIFINELKNTTLARLPKISDIKDGLFKILLFSQIKAIYLDDVKYSCKVGLKLSGCLSSSIQLPNTLENIDSFIAREKLSKSEKSSIIMLNEEATENGYEVQIIPNTRVDISDRNEQ